MIHQAFKDFYFGVVRYAVLPNTWLARFRYRNVPEGGYRLHLGCGPKYIKGMVNVDGNFRRRTDCWLDLRNPLPFPTGGASLVYSSHMLEHIFPDQALKLLAEIRRVLSDDGVARIAVPSMEYALEIARGEHEMIYPREFKDPAAQAINYLFCDGQHKFGYSAGLLTDFAKEAGFTRIEVVSQDHGVAKRKYGDYELGDEPEGSLVVELAR